MAIAESEKRCAIDRAEADQPLYDREDHYRQMNVVIENSYWQSLRNLSSVRDPGQGSTWRPGIWEFGYEFPYPWAPRGRSLVAGGLVVLFALAESITLMHRNDRKCDGVHVAGACLAEHLGQG